MDELNSLTKKKAAHLNLIFEMILIFSRQPNRDPLLSIDEIIGAIPQLQNEDIDCRSDLTELCRREKTLNFNGGNVYFTVNNADTIRRFLDKGGFKQLHKNRLNKIWIEENPIKTELIKISIGYIIGVFLGAIITLATCQQSKQAKAQLPCKITNAKTAYNNR
jgi:hypothetical protein